MEQQLLKAELTAFFDRYQAGIDWSRLDVPFDKLVLAKGDCVFRQGQPANRLCFLNRGLVRYFSVSEKGKEYTQTLIKGPRMIGSTRAMTQNEPAPFTIEALEPCEVVTCAWAPFYRTMCQDLAFMHAYARFLESIFINKELKESSMATHTATRRYVDFCEAYPELRDTLPKQQIAAYIGITPVALSRIRAQLKLGN